MIICFFFSPLFFIKNTMIFFVCKIIEAFPLTQFRNSFFKFFKYFFFPFYKITQKMSGRQISWAAFLQIQMQFLVHSFIHSKKKKKTTKEISIVFNFYICDIYMIYSQRGHCTRIFLLMTNIKKTNYIFITRKCAS